MTKNIIFDFGNVLVQWHPEIIYTEYFGDEVKAWWFFRHIIDNDWRLRIDGGESMNACIAESSSSVAVWVTTASSSAQRSTISCLSRRRFVFR